MDENDTDTFNENVLVELECPICTVYMIPPIRLCERGHSICETCMLKLQRCPFCQGNFINAKNIALQALAHKTLYPCTNKPLGCNIKLKLEERDNHEKTCLFNNYKCAMKRCTWTGTLKDIANHWVLCRSKELRCSFSRYYIKVVAAGDSYLSNMAGAFSQLFWIKCKLENERIYWAVQLLGHVGEASNYCYEIDICKLESSESRITFRDYCKSVKIGNNVLLSPDVCLTTISTKYLKRLLDEDQNLHYTVQIYKPN